MEITNELLAAYEGKLEGLDVVVVQCGVGKVNAAMCAQILCSVYGVTHIVNTGIAGSLCADLDIGDLVICRDAMYHDFDCVHFGYEMGKVPGMDVVAFPADEAMIGYACAAAEAVHPGHWRMGRVASGDLFVAQKAAKEAIIKGIDVSQAIVDHTVLSNNTRYNKIEKMAEYLVDMFPNNGAVMTQCFGETIVGQMLKVAKNRGKNNKNHHYRKSSVIYFSASILYGLRISSSARSLGQYSSVIGMLFQENLRTLLESVSISRSNLPI